MEARPWARVRLEEGAAGYEGAARVEGAACGPHSCVLGRVVGGARGASPWACAGAWGWPMRAGARRALARRAAAWPRRHGRGGPWRRRRGEAVRARARGCRRVAARACGQRGARVQARRRAVRARTSCANGTGRSNDRSAHRLYDTGMNVEELMFTHPELMSNYLIQSHGGTADSRIQNVAS